MTFFENPVPVLQVADVERSIGWYSSVLGFDADPFPDKPPYSFAILRRDGTEIMLRRGESATRHIPPKGWSIYLRVSGGRLLEFAEIAGERAELTRAPERAFYGQVEFEIMDPDGHIICIAEPLPSDVDVPLADER